MPGRPGGRSAPRILSAMFSRRLKWPCPPNRLSRLLDEKRTRPTRLFDLTESNPTRAGLSYPAEAIAAALAVVLVHPNSPTGTALRRGERSRLQEICAGRGAALISDEVFFDYLDSGEVGEAARSGDPIVSAVSAQAPGFAGQAGGALTFALGGLSKACGLPQMKLGWIVADGPGKAVSEALERLDLIADTYLSVGTPVKIGRAHV